MSSAAKHPYHMVNPSPWPAMGGLSALVLAVGAILTFHKAPVFGAQLGLWNLAPGFVLVLATMIGWWKDVIHESVVEHAHTPETSHGLRMGMVLFIASEVMFFFAFFWAFFHSALGFSPATVQWPPAGIHVLDAWEVPFYNTVILLSSGITLTRAHLYVEKGNNELAARWTFITAFLGVIFLGFQVFEYVHASFKLTEGVYPSVFYFATGFHGFHVFVGTTFLFVCAFRAKAGHFTAKKHIGFQAAAWYWHFVDVVWLFLFIFVYWILGLPVREFVH